MSIRALPQLQSVLALCIALLTACTVVPDDAVGDDASQLSADIAAPVWQGEQLLDFGATCSSTEFCHYKNANEGQSATMSCAPGAQLNVLSATYAAASSQMSCLPYVSSECQGQNSCTILFSNDVDHCDGDPAPGLSKFGRATAVCQTSKTIKFGSGCPAHQTCDYTGAFEGYDSSKNVTMTCPTGTALHVIDATYYTASSQQSCTAYVSSVCQGKNSCSVLFNNDADHCNGDPDPNVPKSGKATVLCVGPDSIPPLATRFVGRFDFTDQAGPQTSVSASEIQLGFMGTNLSVTINSANEANYTVLVDGLAPTSLRVAASTATYQLPLVSPLAMGPHTARLIRNDEFILSGVSQLQGVDYGPNGRPLDLQPWTGRTIEVLGDSYSNGLAVLSPYPPPPNTPCPFTADIEDVNLSWGALAAKDLGAEFREIAVSGATSGFINMSYPYALPADDRNPYNFNLQKPADAVAIFLGDNDEPPPTPPGSGHGPVSKKPPTSYTLALEGLVTKVFKNSPNAQIFWIIYRSDTPKHNAWVEAKFPAQLANHQFHNVSFSLRSSTGINTCTGHPTKGLHAAWAAAFESVYQTVFSN